MSDTPTTPAADASPPVSNSKWAKNQTELAARLLPPRERAYIKRSMKLPGCPGRTADGRYNIAAWQAWLETVGPVGQTETGGGAAARIPAQMRKLEEQALLLEVQRKTKEWEFEVKKGRYILREEAVNDAAKKFSEVRQALLQLPGILAPSVIASPDIPSAEIKIREAIVRALRALADPSPPLPVAVQPAATESPVVIPASPYNIVQGVAASAPPPA
ncbi:MAG: hypothetical protein LBK99_16495 [Opitutaceae bacterium]|jgi:hypothetical protein|nr:hypothetical protein [Opitutaceae bacterium]